MTPHVNHHALLPGHQELSGSDLRLIEQFSRLVSTRLDILAQGPDRSRLLDLATRALNEARIALGTDLPSTQARLPVSKLKVSEVVEQGWVELSQASLYRAVDNKRFYCVTPKGRSIGKEFPAWQFIQPVPELIAPVLAIFTGQPSSEIHAFWVSSAEELNDLSPAEMLAGKSFETRAEIHSSQQALLDLPARERLRKVITAAQWQQRGMADIIG
ncbi:MULTISPECIES: hypothetical protein [unclassified Janthinobacterium]|uniref:hypothetical protein n=1 Tax=unclassified Janthinobacterium TaxID=2610881 RepID=UPI0017E70FC7|nr:MULTISPECIES: hypothetical protein [unclassified Janthinobacterium]MBB5606106.1 hypothetical protein [Janthinobacterium sp. S3T4]MBB5616064.1 hypothetical protein [Janthinobacterium sp. S3M3]